MAEAKKLKFGSLGETDCTRLSARTDGEQVDCPLLDVDAFRAERSFNCPRVNRFAKIWFQNFTGARPHRNMDVTPAPDKV